MTVRKCFVLFMIVLVISQSIIVSNVQASDIAMTLEEVAAAGSGAAALGSAALGVAVPIVVLLACCWAGYEIIDHREEIW